MPNANDSTTTRTHGGRRAGSGRKKKSTTSNSSTTMQQSASNIQPFHATSTSAVQPRFETHTTKENTPNVPIFFSQRASQKPSRPLPTSNSGTSAFQTLSSSVSSSQQSREDILTIANETFQHLVSEIDEVMENDEHADSRIEEGRQVDESISDIVRDDSMEENAETAESETRNSEIREHSVIHQHLLDFRNSIRKEISQLGMPKCYKDGQFFVHFPHPVFALHNAICTSFSPDPLCLRSIFVWLPEFLPDEPSVFADDEAMLTSSFQAITIIQSLDASAPRLEMITSSSRTVTSVILAMQVIEDVVRVIKVVIPISWVSFLDGFKKHSHAYLTARGAVDKLVIDQMKPCFAGRFGPEPFSKMLHELQMLQHSRRELMYLSAAAAYGLSGSQVPRFPSFDDPMKYAGSSPSVRYLKCIWTDYHSAVKIYHDRIQASLSGFKLAGDHTFRIMKAMARLKSEPIFSALFSLVNEWEEIRAQAMGLTKGFSILPEMFKQVQKGLEEHGHQPTNIYYCDNPSAERDFHERTMDSLKRNVIHITSPRNDIEARYPYLELPPNVAIKFYSTYMLINNACESILEAVEALPPSETLVLALSVSCTVQRSLFSIQFRTSDKLAVFEITHLTPGQIPPCLRSVLTSCRIIKVGHGVMQLITLIATSLDIPDLLAMVPNSDGPFLDLGRLAKVKGAVQDAYAPLDSLVHAVLKWKLPDLPDISLPAASPGSGHWSRSSALHVDSVWKLYQSLSQHKSVGLRLHPSEARVGQLVTLVASRKEVAEGIILDHDGTVNVVMDETGSTTQLRITPAYSLIQITKVLVPGSIVSKHNQTVQWISDHGSKAVVQTRTLHTRSPISPLPFDPSSTTNIGIPAPPSLIDMQRSHISIGPSQGLRDRALPMSSEENDDSLVSVSNADEDNAQELIEDEDDHINPSYLDDDDNGLGEELDDDDIEPTPEELIVNSVQEVRSLLTQQQDSQSSLASRVYDDVFHFMDRLLRTLPKKHSAFKEFSYQFSETIFVRDEGDLKAVKSVLEKKKISWDYVVRAKRTWVNQHVRRYIPPPAKLEADLKLLFESFKNIVCSSDVRRGRGRFFSKESNQVSQNLLDTVHSGFLSDPPGIPLYYIIGWDRDGLPLYRTIRGTNSIEGGVHMLIRRIFGSLKASPELAVALLSNWILQRNQRVGHLNRTGHKWGNHFNIWLLDEITELTIHLDIRPSFHPPRMLATRIATSESFGIIPIPSALAKDYNISTLPLRRIEGLPHHRDTPVHLLTRLSTRITNPYRYLQLTQCTIFPVIPVHTKKEYAEFKRLVGSESIQSSRNVPANQAWKGINYIKFAKLWNVLVDTQDPTVTDSNERIYYKLPEQLLRHHKKQLEWQASQATMLDGSNAAMIHDHQNLLGSPNRIAHVLPAVPLQDLNIQLDPTVNRLQGVDLTSFNPMALLDGFPDSQFVASEDQDRINLGAIVASTEHEPGSLNTHRIL
ncbi:hypothetical protein FB446DRAFT_789987 [Lentinula raphanica]|nr:hypothetical protein FB446DRAFT_789987 [Lentinula raphanica]